MTCTSTIHDCYLTLNMPQQHKIKTNCNNEEFTFNNKHDQMIC